MTKTFTHFKKDGDRHIRYINCEHETPNCFLNIGKCCCGCKWSKE